MVRILRRHIRVFHNKYGVIRPGGVGVPCTPSDIINNTGFQFHRPDGAGSFISAITCAFNYASLSSLEPTFRRVIALFFFTMRTIHALYDSVYFITVFASCSDFWS